MKHIIPCPKCESLSIEVVCIKYDEENCAVRRKLCRDCEHRFYTLQYPEAIVSNREIKYTKGGRTVIVLDL